MTRSERAGATKRCKGIAGPAFWAAVMLVTLYGPPAAFSQERASPPSPSAARAPAFPAVDVQSFIPTLSFNATSLEGWLPRTGTWKAEDGEYVGTVDESGSALLLGDDRFQDLMLSTSFRCDRPCLPGIVIRAETSDGQTSGALYALGEDETGAFKLVLDADGTPVERTSLAESPSPYPQSMMDFRSEYPGLGMLYPGQLGAEQSYTPVDVTGRWNRAEVLVVGNSIRGRLNGPGTPEANVAGIGRHEHGQIGLYVTAAPGTRIRFREVGITKMDAKRALPPEKTAPRFRKMELDAMFYSEAVTAADVDLDGNLDVVSGPNIFMGPDFTTRREIFVPHSYADTTYPDPLLSSAGDLTGDGYPDVLHTGEPGRPGFLYVNPGEDVRRWEKHMVIPSVDNEAAFLDDIDGDGQLEYIYGDGGYIGYAKPGPDPTEMWTFHPITERGPWGAMYAHGIGTGDVDGDGRKDLIQAYGWWEQPEELTGDPWTYHPQTFGRWGTQQGGAGGGRAYAYDVSGDGLNDVITSLEGHGFGLAWFEQKRDAAGEISFERHMIMDDYANPNDGVSFAALHALTLGDVDGDGLLDIITGKRYWAHFGENPSDPDAFGAPVVYWFRLVRDGGEVRFEPELINNHSGVGTDMTAADLNDDGLADVMTSTRFGTHIFLTQPNAGSE